MKGGLPLISTAWVRVLLLLSVFLNILLARDVSTLKRNADKLIEEGRLKVGAAVPSIRAHSVEGEDDVLNFAEFDAPTVLYVFTPQCPWCRKNVGNLHALIESSGPRFRVVGISLTSRELKEYLSQEHLNFRVYTDLQESTRIAYHLGGTPMTIVISPQAEVLKVWYGAYQDDIRPEIERYFHVHLPGCCGTKE
jgi:peroxiredoxin